ncbi:hypothetical protein ACFXHA_09860 [Nocardia sp. NPDC059240]|uniref:hypothetical protein n=1 Tax=Nocardia sp. NPDC059240 TaxID=3346786 RepID=UPI003677F81D
MSGVEDSPMQFPGWEQDQVPPGASSDATATEFGPLPPVPPLEQPHAVFTVQSDTASRMGAALAARMLRTPTFWMWTVLLWGGIAGVVTLFMGRPGAILGGVLLVTALVTRPLDQGRLRRKYTALAATTSVPGTVTAIRFGPDALDGSGQRGRTRMHYNEIRSVFTDRNAVVMRYRSGLLAFPRELFPDWSIELITQTRQVREPANETTVPPLPPIPTITNPTATFVCTPDTARRMARAYTPHALRPLLRTAAILAGMPLGIALIAHNRLGLTVALALLAVVAGFLALVAIITSRQTNQSYAHAVPPGLPITARYGPDAVDFQQADAWTRTPYSTIRSITLRGPITVVTTSRPTVCPRELIPAHAIAHMCAINPRIIIKR